MKRTATIVIFTLAMYIGHVRAQLQDEEDNQSWNDLQLTLPVNDYFEFNTAVTMRLGKNITRVNDSRWAFGFTVKPNKAFSIQPFYWHIRARNAISQFKTEHRLNLRGDPRGIYGRYPPVQPGWFPDPQNRSQLRFFDGALWTGYTAATFGQ